MLTQFREERTVDATVLDVMVLWWQHRVKYVLTISGTTLLRVPVLGIRMLEVQLRLSGIALPS